MISNRLGRRRRLYGLPLSWQACLAVVALSAVGCSSTQGVRPVLLGEEEVQKTGVQLTPMNQWNSPADDFGVTMPLDSSLAFFTSSRSAALGRHSIFYSHNSVSGWSVPEPAVVVNNDKSNGMPVITPGGTTMYFTGCDYGLGDCDLYRVDIGPRGAVPTSTVPWSVPSNMGLPINSSYWDSQPTIAVDGSVIYFSSDRPGGVGGKDIWFSRRRRDGSWSPPINAGEEINTAFDEVTPWIAPDNQTLLFSSNGHPGLGGFDLFSVAIGADDVEVRNLGTPINSSADDIALTLSANGSQAYLASNRKGGLGGYDIYRVDPVPVVVDPVMVVRGTVRDKQGRPVFGNVEVVDLRSSKEVGSFITDPQTGGYAVVLPRAKEYSITAQGSGYLFSSKRIDVPWNLEHISERSIDFSLQSIDGAIRLLVFFEPGTALLERESTSDLDRIVQILAANKSYTVEIAGHTDNTGDPQVNQDLSKQRAQAVKSYLVGNRIAADRIEAVGYGASQPIATNDTEEGRAMNRRVEVRFKIPQ